MKFHIRQATTGDSAAIAQVHVRSWRTTYAGIVPEEYLASMKVEVSAGHWNELLASGEVIAFVAESGDGIFGFSAGGRLRNPLDHYEGELYALYVLREHHRQGAGREMVAGLVKELQRQAIASMVVWVLAQNDAVSFYKHLGATQIGQGAIRIGGVTLDEVALGWPSLSQGFARLAPD